MTDENGKRYITLSKALAIAGVVISLAISLVVMLSGGWARNVEARISAVEHNKLEIREYEKDLVLLREDIRALSEMAREQGVFLREHDRYTRGR